ncbi:MAG: hypothetical protein FJ086_16210, partial [Deltaproteobacteria bacterium]|nr:hypothetical protein [Deltaproteobacteria bacterium]
MRPPSLPDSDLAVMMLDLATRTWAHGVDAFIEGLEVLSARGVPLGRFQLHLAIHHPLLTGGRLSWEPGRGGRWAVQVEGRWVVEERSVRAAGDNPLHREGQQAYAMDWLVDGLAPELCAALQDPAHPLPALVPAGLPGTAAALAGAMEFGASRRSLLLFCPEDGEPFQEAHVRSLHTFAWGMSAVLRANRWRVLATILARTYLGPRTGMRVLGG